jgi:hypothetical protein
MTTAMQCPSCGGRQDAGLLCADCCAAVLTMLAAVPQLVAQLDVAISRQARIGNAGKAGKGTAHERLPINFGTVAVRDALVIEAAYVGQDINWLRAHVQAAELVVSFGKAVKAAYAAIDRAREREYLGVCSYTEDGAVCHAELWAKVKAQEVKCTQCEHVYDVGDRREWLLDQAEDMIFTPREAALYVGEVGGRAVGHQRIRNYLDRGRIAVRPSHDGVKRLRMGDLMQVLRDDAARHTAKAS